MKNLNNNILKYFVAASSGALTDYVTFAILNRATGGVYLPNIVGFFVGTYINLQVCKFYVFKQVALERSRVFYNYFLTFLVVIIISVQIDLLSAYWSVLILKAFLLIESFMLNYFIRKRFVFSEN